MMKQSLRLTALTLLLSHAAVASEPYVPSDEATVLETLPTDFFARRDGIAKLRDRLAEEPENAQVAATIAQHYAGLGKSEGDPRFYGYARAAIRPWWDGDTAPPVILKVRAKLKETDHAYAAALADLRLLLDEEPGDIQAWVEVANINRVLGNYANAEAACDQLNELGETIPARVARLPLMAVTGQAEPAYKGLVALLPEAEESLPAIVPWVHTLLAEMADALGRDEQAESHFTEGIKAAPDNSYLKRAYADFLLDQARGEEVLRLLGDDLKDNGLLLRAAIAAKQAGRQELADRWSEKLRDRFRETRLRGDLPHGRYEGRFELEFGNDSQRALAIALANWQRQKEPRDTRNTLEAALAAGKPEAVAPVLTFLEQHGVQHAILEGLAVRLGGVR